MSSLLLHKTHFKIFLDLFQSKWLCSHLRAPWASAALFRRESRKKNEQMCRRLLRFQPSMGRDQLCCCRWQPEWGGHWMSPVGLMGCPTSGEWMQCWVWWQCCVTGDVRKQTACLFVMVMSSGTAVLTSLSTVNCTWFSKSFFSLHSKSANKILMSSLIGPVDLSRICKH